MRVTQIVDSQMSYQKIFRHASADDPAAGNTPEMLARIVETRGRGGLVVCPKQLRDSWEELNRLPGWELWNFGAIRGRDEAREVPQLVVISRPSPNPGEVETQAATIFGLAVKRLQPETMYPKNVVGRLMADGTGRRALAYRHPDPMVEAVRFAICEGELLQANGRGRGVRRSEKAPLEVLILSR
jgi:putative DNA primase/helicase